MQFGDGKTGKRLPSGLKNVRAIYRTGNGAYGPLQKDVSVQAGARLPALDKIQLPGLVTGGSEPEDGANAREVAPGKVQSLGRLVSLDDYVTEAQAMPGVTRAQAAWQLVDNIPTMVVTILMDNGREDEMESIRQSLNEANRCRGAQRFPIEVIQGIRVQVGITAEFAYDPTYREEDIRAAIELALGTVRDDDEPRDGLFAMRNRRFGEAEFANRIVGYIQNVAGVNWARVTGLERIPDVAHPPAILAVTDNVLCGQNEMLALHIDHLTLPATFWI